MNRRKSILFKVCLLLFSVLFSLLFVEGLLRLKAYRDDAKREWAWERVGEVNSLPEYEEVGLWQMSRLNKNPKIIYELIPMLNVIFKGQPVHTDDHGFRSTHQPSASSPVKTLVGLGDSVMFGWGVSDGDTYLSRLATRIGSAHPDQSWNIYNTGVPGYNTVMEVETFKEKGLPLSPDIVLMHFIRNDLDLPNFIHLKTNVFDLRRLFLRDYFSRDRRFRHHGLNRMVDVPFDPVQGKYVTDMDQIPKEYRSLVGEPAFEQAVHELHALSKQQPFQLVILCDMEAPSFLTSLCTELDLQLIETGDAVHARLREVGAGSLLEANLVLSAEDSHPSVAGHDLIAELLYAELVD